MFSLDSALTRFLNAGAIGLFEPFALFAGGLLIVAVLMLALVPWIMERLWQITVRAVGASIVAFAISQLFKGIIARPRPSVADSTVRALIAKNSDDPSFPSSHASVAFAVAFALMSWSRWWGASALVVAILVGIGRVMVGVHYPSDILGGALVGFISAWFVKYASQHADVKR